ncbi:hydroxyacid dehydrogenase [Fodinisporobacter ferrooxydans]|uniref:Hydroxyacid dehydrogenase n=1 Tax=Fodinisporobacter ferrooxydans TaxID=2901836 RepID=A0ABY4CNF6_9BACL|nr:hydroxyacid dehydrogenase [Alicyclobacillaceae bacterium MYW30-H2]
MIGDPTLYGKPEALADLAANAQALVIRNKTRIDRQLLKQLPQLQAIGRLGVGLDNIDIAACRERGVKVIAARGCNANAVAEYVFACMLEHARFLQRCDEATREGHWNRLLCMGRELNGKTLGLIGVGDIGQRVATRARAFGMQVIAYDPFVIKTHSLIQDFGVRLDTLRQVCREGDYISIHVPLTPATHSLIDEAQLAEMKETAVLINTARGGIIHESALHTSLQNHPNRYAFLDVREKEPPAADDPFRQLPNVILTPHVAGITQESSQRVAEMIFEDIDQVLQGQQVLTEVQ